MWLSDLFDYILKLLGIRSEPKTYKLVIEGDRKRRKPRVDRQLKKQLWAIGGGKGGVGKSLTSVMLGASLAKWGKKVILVDADLGGGNLNTLTGIKYPRYTLADFINGNITNIQDIALDTAVENMKVICGADAILDIANPQNAQKIRLFNNLKKLEADIIMLDLGAGTSYTTMDFFLFAKNKIIVVSPETTSIQNGYGFVKSCLFRKLTREFRKDKECMGLIERCMQGEDEGKIESIADLREKFTGLGEEQSVRLDGCLEDMNMGLILNMVKSKEAVNVGKSLITTTGKYLSVTPDYLGAIDYNPKLETAVNNMTDFLRKDSAAITGMGFYDLGAKVLKQMFRESKNMND
ncbi:MAG: AAA family ATPase [Nitrospira sp.]|nr:AAA family ATPase [Nitrospira sp.]